MSPKSHSEWLTGTVGVCLLCFLSFYSVTVKLINKSQNKINNIKSNNYSHILHKRNEGCVCVFSLLTLLSSYLLKEVICGLSVAHLSSQYLYWNLGVLLNKCYFIACTIVPHSLPHNLDVDLRSCRRQIEEDGLHPWQNKTMKAQDFNMLLRTTCNFEIWVPLFLEFPYIILDYSWCQVGKTTDRGEEFQGNILGVHICFTCP